MTKQDNPGTETLQSFVEKLDKTHYDVVYALCDTANEQVKKLQKHEVLQTASQYVIRCNQLIGEIQPYISIKKEHLIPYAHSLFEKDVAGHDCSKCTGTGSCSLQHDMQLMEIKESHKQLRGIIRRLQMVALPLYSGDIHPGLYKTLQNQMALLENNLAAILQLEETQLVPQITAAQLNINANG